MLCRGRDLPLKVLIWGNEGQTCVSYYGPAAIAARYHLRVDLAARLASIDSLTDALVSQREGCRSIRHPAHPLMSTAACRAGTQRLY
jgi:hypothetical protein